MAAKILPRRVIREGGNLFALAATLYGDATLANILARANALVDPFLDGVVTLVVPAADAAQSGGLPPGAESGA